MPCPKCREQGRDKTGNHMMVFSDNGGYCNRCGYTVEDVDGQSEDNVVSINQSNKLSLTDIQGFRVTALPSRKISKATCEVYGVKTSCNQSTGEIDKHYYPITRGGTIVAYKEREIATKQFDVIPKGASRGKVDLFGQSVMPQSGKKVLITAGEEDTLAAYEMLKDKYPNSRPAVVSLPKGENATSAVADQLEYLEGFNEIILYMDMDEAGRKATEVLSQLIGEKVRVMKTLEKDASDMHTKGKQAEFINAYFSAQAYKPEGFVQFEDVFEDATKMPEWGRPWPWDELNKLTYGRRDGEGIYVGAGVKIGKSEFVNQMAQHIIVNEGGKVAMFKFEEQPSMTYRRIAGKIMNKQFHVPDGDFTRDELIEGVNKVGDSLVCFDSYMSTNTGELWTQLKPAIRHAVLVGGCKDVFIDPITNLTDGLTPSETETELRRISNELAAMSKELGFFYYCFCHLKAPHTGKPHEEGGKVHSNQFRGSRAMMEKTYYMLGIERNKDPDNSEVVRNMSTFVLLEDRSFGNAGKFKVYYDNATGSYLEPDGDTLEKYYEMVGD